MAFYRRSGYGMRRSYSRPGYRRSYGPTRRASPRYRASPGRSYGRFRSRTYRVGGRRY